FSSRWNDTREHGVISRRTYGDLQMRFVTKVMAALVLVTASGGIGLGASNCGFLTIEQCRATVTGGGSFFVAHQTPPARPNRPVPAKGKRRGRLRGGLRPLSVVRLLFGPRELKLGETLLKRPIQCPRCCWCIGIFDLDPGPRRS